MPAVDLPPDHTGERPVPYAAVSAIQASETEAILGYWTRSIRAGLGEALIIAADESGPPADEYRTIQVPVEDDYEFDPVIPFKADGIMRARLAEEAPDFKVEWDF